MAPPSLRNFHKVRQRPPQPLWRSLFSQKKIIKTYLCLQKLSTRSVSSNFHTEFEINPLESDFYRPTPSRLEFPGPLTPSPPPSPLGISNSVVGVWIFSRTTHCTFSKVLVIIVMSHALPSFLCMNYMFEAR